LFIVKLYESGRMYRQESALRFSQAQTILLVLPGTNDVYLGHSLSSFKRLVRANVNNACLSPSRTIRD
jgi:hypothetical protein